MFVLRNLNKKFDLFFLEYKSLFFFKGILGSFSLRFSSFFFYKKKNDVLSYFFNKRYFFNSFLGHFLFIYKKLYAFHFYKFKLRGLGYRIKFIASNLIRFFMGMTNYYFFFVPLNILVKARRRKMYLFSNDRMLLSNVFLCILSLKKLIPYKLRGFFFPKQVIYMNLVKSAFSCLW